MSDLPTRTTARLALSLLFVGGLAPIAEGADWPMLHQNPQLTRVLDGDGVIASPSVRWKRRLGGTNPEMLVQDVDGDGRVELVTLVAGRMLCYDPEAAQLIWDTPAHSLGFFLLDADGRAHDMNGDGRLDLLVSKATVGDTRVHAFDGQTGQLQWTFGEGLGPNSGTNGQNRHALLNIDSDPQLELVLYVPSNQNGAILYAFDFGAGFGGDVLQWQTEGLYYKGTVQVSVFDATGDGQVEALMMQASVLTVFAGADGAMLKTSEPAWYGESPAIPYGQKVVPTQIVPDAAHELFVVYKNGGIGGFYGIWKLDAALEPQTLWRVAVPGRGVVNLPVDVDGDGLDEVVASVFEGVGDDGKWITRLHDGETGEVLDTIDNWVVVRHDADLFGDGGREVMMQFAPDETVDPLANVQPAQWDGVDLVPVWDGGLADSAVAGVSDRDHDGVDELVVYRDGNQDGVTDSLAIVGSGLNKALILATYAFPKFHEVLYRGTFDHVVGTEIGQVVTFSNDGFLDVLHTELAPTGQRVRVGGYAPSFLVADQAAYVNDSVGRVLRIDTATGAPDTDPTTSTFYPIGSGRTVLAIIDVDNDGGPRELFVHEAVDGEHHYRLFEAGGQEQRWAWHAEGATSGPETGTAGIGGDMDGDGELDFYVMTPIAGVRTGHAIASGQEKWSWQPYQPGGGKGTAYHPALLTDLNNDGTADVVVSHFHDRLDGHGSVESDPLAPIHAFDGLTGEILSTSSIGLPPGQLMAVDLDGSAATRDVLLTWWDGRGALSFDRTAGGSVSVLWGQKSAGPITKGMPMALDLDGDPAGVDDLVHFDHSVGRVRAIRGSDGALLWERWLWSGYSVDTLAAKANTGALAPQAAAVTNLTGLGHPSGLFGDGAGRVYCVNLTDGSLDWVYDLGFAIGAVVAADTDGDGLVEVLVTAADGYLYALGHAADVGTIAEVRDGMGADVDAVTGVGSGIHSEAFAANWSPASGGSEPVVGYFVRLLTDSGAVVADWIDAGADTQIAATGYATLSPGIKYRVLVMPYGVSGAGAIFKSDGFWFSDQDGDGLVDEVEAELGTDPLDPDSDGVGLSDGVETNYGEAIDTDGDGLIDALDSDSDADGVPDSAEGIVDTDGDGHPDFQDADDDDDGIATATEVADGAVFGSDPDGDGLTNPYDTDSDGDGLSDYEEGALDTDGDGVPEYLDAKVAPVDPGAGPSVVVVEYWLRGGRHAEPGGCVAAPRGAPASGAVVLLLLLLLGLAIGAARTVRRSRRP